ncbi:jg17988 [Pararge aegeria aegeria]|uniref:Jg17988 protein n=1 Tax=Pararge aegeria aegeria TaxID=348720 RepID=A0A8S4S9A0_9NEOP|nr:jg17988 [Pararge aegeria aegeria]
MELFITENGKYRIESLSPTTFPGALRIIRDVFCQDENVSIGSEVNKNLKAAEELLELCADAALDGVSLVAIEINTGEVVSVSFNKIQIQTTDASEKPFFDIFAEERCTQASSRSLIQFMANVDARCNFFKK